MFNKIIMYRKVGGLFRKLSLNIKHYEQSSPEANQAPLTSMTTPSSPIVKFLCSHGGRILPRPQDGKLRYVGGQTRIITIHRSINFVELMRKLEEMLGIGNRVGLRCQLPTLDLDALISITSDEDLINFIEEHDHSPSYNVIKVRAFLVNLPHASGIHAVGSPLSVYQLTRFAPCYHRMDMNSYSLPGQQSRLHRLKHLQRLEDKHIFHHGHLWYAVR